MPLCIQGCCTFAASSSLPARIKKVQPRTKDTKLASPPATPKTSAASGLSLKLLIVAIATPPNPRNGAAMRLRPAWSSEFSGVPAFREGYCARTAKGAPTGASAQRIARPRNWGRELRYCWTRARSQSVSSLSGERTTPREPSSKGWSATEAWSKRTPLRAEKTVSASKRSVWASAESPKNSAKNRRRYFMRGRFSGGLRHGKSHIFFVRRGGATFPAWSSRG